MPPFFPFQKRLSNRQTLINGGSSPIIPPFLTTPASPRSPYQIPPPARYRRAAAVTRTPPVSCCTAAASRSSALLTSVSCECQCWVHVLRYSENRGHHQQQFRQFKQKYATSNDPIPFLLGGAGRGRPGGAPRPSRTPDSGIYSSAGCEMPSGSGGCAGDAPAAPRSMRSILTCYTQTPDSVQVDN